MPVLQYNLWGLIEDSTIPVQPLMRTEDVPLCHTGSHGQTSLLLPYGFSIEYSDSACSDQDLMPEVPLSTLNMHDIYGSSAALHDTHMLQETRCRRRQTSLCFGKNI